MKLTNIEILKYELQKKVYRVKSNIQKLMYIQANTGIIDSVILMAAKAAKPNPFHNFGHQIGATESFVKIALAAGIPIEIITEVASVLLFHDADHTGIQKYSDEMRAFETYDQYLDETDFASMGLMKDELSMARRREMFLTTIFRDRGKTDDEIMLMIQDADLGHMGQGPEYQIWASMGLADEFARGGKSDPITFIKKTQRSFINLLVEASGKKKRVFLSDAANKIFTDPRETIDQVESYSVSQIMFAYNNRQADWTLEEFGKRLKAA